MTDAEIKYAIQEYVDAKWNILSAEIAEAKRNTEAAIADATANSLKPGDAVTIQSCNKQIMCAVDGGPTEPNQPFKFESRNADAAGPHETFVLLKP